MSVTKITTQAVPDALKIAGRAGATASEAATDLVAKNTNLGGLNLKEAGLAEDLARLAKSDPDQAAAVRDALKGQLSASNYREVSEAMPAAVLRVEDQALAAKGVSAADRAKILDMVQMGFDVAGIFDPTPASDGISGAISLARGDWLGAGISLVSMVPYVGDLAKAGKIGKWAQAVAGGAEMLAKYGAGTALGGKALASLETIGAAIDKIPGAALDALPASTKRQLLEMRATIDGAVAKATGRGADDVAEATTKVEPATRLPRTGGTWQGEPGNGKWFSDKLAVQEVTRGKGVPFVNGRPDFTEWSKGTVKFQEGVLDGTKDDFKAVYEYIAKQKNLSSPTAAKKLLKEQGLTPHHLDTQTIQLIPTKLHGNVPHAGSASDMRRGV